MAEKQRRGFWNGPVMQLVSIPLAAVGFIGFLSGTYDFDATWQLPNSDRGDAAISETGDIFITSNFYGRIQKYDSQGVFVKGWSVNNRGGIFWIGIDHGTLESYTARGRTLETFDLNGTLLASRMYEKHEETKVPRALDPKILSIVTRSDGTHISLKGRAQPISIKHLWWHYPILHPFVSWLVGTVGLFLNPTWRNGVFKTIRWKWARAKKR